MSNDTDHNPLYLTHQAALYASSSLPWQLQYNCKNPDMIPNPIRTSGESLHPVLDFQRYWPHLAPNDWRDYWSWPMCMQQQGNWVLSKSACFQRQPFLFLPRLRIFPKQLGIILNADAENYLHNVALTSQAWTAEDAFPDTAGKCSRRSAYSTKLGGLSIFTNSTIIISAFVFTAAVIIGVVIAG